MANQIKTFLEDRLVREAERKSLTTLSRTAAWQLEQKGLFPKRRKLHASGQGVCWLYSELMEWINSREAVSSKEV